MKHHIQSTDASAKIYFVIYKKNGLMTEGTPFINRLMEGFERQCKLLGYEMVLQSLDRRSTDFERQVKELLDSPRRRVVLVGAELLDEDYPYFQNPSCKLLILDYWNQKVPCDSLLINNEDGVETAIAYLAEQGHREIGYLKSDFRIHPFCQRERGYRMGLLTHDLPYHPHYTFEVSSTMEGAYQDMKAKLTECTRLPTAFFADNDMIAHGCIKALQEQGLQVPEDVSVIGFDDISVSALSNPPLTSLSVAKQQMGELAARYIIQQQSTPENKAVKILVNPELIIRNSVKQQKRSEQ